MNAIFTKKDSLLANDYLTGITKWPYDVVIDGAILTCAPGLAPVGVSLVLGGILTGAGFVVQPGDGAAPQAIVIAITVPANTEVRWQAVTAPSDPAASISEVAITISATAKGSSPATPLTVRWVNGLESTPLFSYDPTTDIFTDISGGLAAARAEVMQGSPLEIIFPGIGLEVMRVESNTLIVNQMTVAGSGFTPTFPALEFMVGAVVVATLTADGTLTAAAANQGAPVDDGQQFLFYDGDTLVAAFGLTGVVALEFDEPL